MRATPLLLGCLLGLGAIATAAANGSSMTNALGTSSGTGYNCNGQSEHGNGHDEAASTGGDALNVSHGSATSSSPSNHPSSANRSPENDVPRFGEDASPNHSSHGSGLSWQSLLPGSIQ
jgi:hypothetical protein